jgi:hypothetical protein
MRILNKKGSQIPQILASLIRENQRNRRAFSAKYTHRGSDTTPCINIHKGSDPQAHFCINIPKGSDPSSILRISGPRPRPAPPGGRRPFYTPQRDTAPLIPENWTCGGFVRKPKFPNRFIISAKGEAI